MRTHVALQRDKHLAVLRRGSHLTLAQQRRQVVEIPAQRREFGTRCVKRHQEVRAARQAGCQRGSVRQQAGEERAAGEAGPPRRQRVARLRHRSIGWTALRSRAAEQPEQACSSFTLDSKRRPLGGNFAGFENLNGLPAGIHLARSTQLPSSVYALGPGRIERQCADRTRSPVTAEELVRNSSRIAHCGNPAGKPYRHRARDPRSPTGPPEEAFRRLGTRQSERPQGSAVPFWSWPSGCRPTSGRVWQGLRKHGHADSPPARPVPAGKLRSDCSCCHSRFVP